MSVLVPSSPAQKIQGGVGGDAIQPALRISHGNGCVPSLHRFHQRILNNILAVDHRARHAGAIPMELRSRLQDKAFEFAERVSHPVTYVRCTKRRMRSLPWSLQNTRDRSLWVSRPA